MKYTLKHFVILPKRIIMAWLMVNRKPSLIAFNAHLLVGEASYRSAGIASYMMHLLRCLSTANPNLDYALLLGDVRLPGDLTGFHVLRSHFKTHRPIARIFWEQTLLPWVLYRIQADVLHAPAFVGPIMSPCPQVITVHDLSFLRHPEFFRRGNRLYLSLMTGLACRRAAAVIAVSDFTAREVTALLNVPPSRVHTVYHGVDPAFHPLPEEAVARFRREKNLPEKFILYLGTLEPRKNLCRLVRAFARLSLPNVHLVLAGGRGWLYEEIFAEVERCDLEGRVHFPGYVPTDALPLWYNAAVGFAYISNYEGFGLPVVEALACGTPTVTASTSSLPEVAGDAAILVSPEDEDAMVEALQRLLMDGELRRTLRQRGLARASRFSWAQAALQTTAVYQVAMHERRVS